MGNINVLKYLTPVSGGRRYTFTDERFFGLIIGMTKAPTDIFGPQIVHAGGATTTKPDNVEQAIQARIGYQQLWDQDDGHKDGPIGGDSSLPAVPAGIVKLADLAIRWGVEKHAPPVDALVGYPEPLRESVLNQISQQLHPTCRV